MPTRTLTTLAVGVLLVAASASAAPIAYTMTAGSRMSIVNAACSPCTVPVTGSVTLDDDGAGNVTLAQVSLAHDAYQVALPGFISIVLDRDSISLGAGTVTGSGSTLTSAVMGPASLAHVGTISCTSEVVTCGDLLGIPDGTFSLPSPIGVDLGTWTFDGSGGLLAAFVYTSLSGGASSTETLHLVGASAPIPEPAPAALIAIGLAALAIERRARTARGRQARNKPTTARRLVRWSALRGAPIR